jgi:hypothetical protein
MRRVGEGRPIGTCACGCGGELTERVYEFRRGDVSWTTRRRPRFLPGHASRVRANWLASTVPAEEIAARVLEFKHKGGYSWSDVARVLGLSTAAQAQALTRRRYLKRWRARLILLALAGQPRPPTAYERRISDLAERRAALNRAARRRREQRAGARDAGQPKDGADPNFSGLPGGPSPSRSGRRLPADAGAASPEHRCGAAPRKGRP